VGPREPGLIDLLSQRLQPLPIRSAVYYSQLIHFIPRSHERYWAISAAMWTLPREWWGLQAVRRCPCALPGIAKGKTILGLRVVLEENGWTLTAGTGASASHAPGAITDRLETGLASLRESAMINQTV